VSKCAQGSIKVLLADDQPLVRTGFRMILDVEEDIEVVAEVGDGAAAVSQAAVLRPDVVVMDIRMPVQDGIAATALIAAAGTARVLILTTFHLDENVFGALQAGASGFLLKDTDATKLVEAIRIVRAGEAIVAPAVTRRLLDQFALQLPGQQAGGDDAAPLAGRQAAARRALGGLSPRENEVLLLVARGLSNAEIASELVVTQTTVKSHVHHMLTKLGARDRVQLVVFAYEAGLAGSANRLT
jgi:DNA-binding NarL/FixJ family response regulator